MAISKNLAVSQFLEAVVSENFHRHGIRCLRLFRADSDFLTEIQAEVTDIVRTCASSNTADPTHITNAVTKPVGETSYYSLYNATGDTSDWSTDYNCEFAGKAFIDARGYPNLNRLLSFFLDTTQFKILGLGPGASLSPHDSSILYRRNGRYHVMLRLHLPVVSPPNATMLIGDQLYRFEEGSVFYFNHGCVHSAQNPSGVWRYHVVWDMRLTERSYRTLFSDEDAEFAGLLSRIHDSMRAVDPIGGAHIADYQLQGLGQRVHSMFRSVGIQIRRPTVQRIVNFVLYLHYRYAKIDFWR